MIKYLLSICPKEIKLHLRFGINKTSFNVKFGPTCACPYCEATVSVPLGKLTVQEEVCFRIVSRFCLPVICLKHPESKIHKVFSLPESLSALDWLLSKVSKEFHYSKERLGKSIVVTRWAIFCAATVSSITATAKPRDGLALLFPRVHIPTTSSSIATRSVAASALSDAVVETENSTWWFVSPTSRDTRSVISKT